MHQARTQGHEESVGQLPPLMEQLASATWQKSGCSWSTFTRLAFQRS